MATLSQRSTLQDEPSLKCSFIFRRLFFWLDSK
jgi:hypothetical protein